MSSQLNPPRWAEHVLRWLLRPDDQQSVTGDLLEEYRESVHPALGQWRADLWYSNQVLGFLWRAVWIFGLLHGGATVSRTALDWFVPTRDFRVRSGITTWAAITIFLCVGFWTAWRSRSIRGGALAGFATGVIGGTIAIVGAGLLYAIWHDVQTRAAIAMSGGLEEVFVLPIFLLVPATMIATLGAIAGKFFGVGWRALRPGVS